MSKRPHSITDFFRANQACRGLLATAREQAVLLQRIQGMIPHPLNSHCIAAVQKETQLIIYVDSAAWASRLRFTTRQLSGQLKSANLKIDRVIVRVMVRTKPVQKPRPPIRLLSAENANLINQTADGLDDPDLSAALKRLGRHTR